MCQEGHGDFVSSVDERETCSYIVMVHTSRICAHPLYGPPASVTSLQISCNPLLSPADYEMYMNGTSCIILAFILWMFFFTHLNIKIKYPATSQTEQLMNIESDCPQTVVQSNSLLCYLIWLSLAGKYWNWNSWITNQIGQQFWAILFWFISYSIWVATEYQIWAFNLYWLLNLSICQLLKLSIGINYRIWQLYLPSLILLELLGVSGIIMFTVTLGWSVSLISWNLSGILC